MSMWPWSLVVPTVQVVDPLNAPPRAGRKEAKVGADGRTNTAFRLKPEVYEQLAAAATEREVSMNWIVNRAIADFLGRLIPVEEIKWTKD